MPNIKCKLKIYLEIKKLKSYLMMSLIYLKVIILEEAKVLSTTHTIMKKLWNKKVQGHLKIGYMDLNLTLKILEKT